MYLAKLQCLENSTFSINKRIIKPYYRLLKPCIHIKTLHTIRDIAMQYATLLISYYATLHNFKCYEYFKKNLIGGGGMCLCNAHIFSFVLFL